MRAANVRAAASFEARDAYAMEVGEGEVRLLGYGGGLLGHLRLSDGRVAEIDDAGLGGAPEALLTEAWASHGRSLEITERLAALEVGDGLTVRVWQVRERAHYCPVCGRRCAADSACSAHAAFAVYGTIEDMQAAREAHAARG